MADTETKIKIKADARELKNVERGMREAFDTRQTQKMERATRDAKRELKDLVSEQVRLADQLKSVEKGTDSYKNLEKQLKRVSESAKAVKGTISAITSAYGDFDQTQRKAEQERARAARAAEQSARAAKQRSFMGGVVQGAGIAQYMPAEPGMMARMAGVGLGGAMRRGFGAAAAPYTMPGMGGLSTMMGAIPIAGPAISGALQTAQGMYQQHVGFQQARLQNLYWSGGPGVFSRGERLQRGYSGEIEALARSQAKETLTQAQDDLKEQQSVKNALIQQKTMLEKLTPKTASGRGLSPEQAQTREMLSQRFRQARLDMQRSKAVLGALGLGESKMTVGDFVSQGISSDIRRQQSKINEARYAVEAARGEIETGSQSARWRAFAQAAGGLGAGRRMFAPGFGTEFGLDPNQVQGMLGQFMGARGGVASASAERQAREAMAAQIGFGVNMQTSGQFARLAMGGGGGTGFGAGLAGVLQTAMEQGLRGSQVTEYLQTMVQLGQQAEQQGVKLNLTEFTRQTSMLGAMGIGELQRGRIAGGFNRAAMAASAQGVQGPAQMLLYRAAGFRPGEGRIGYVRAAERLEGGMNSEIMGNLLSMVAEATKGFSGETPEETMKIRAFHFRRMMNMPGIGIPISAGMATDIIRRMQKTPGQEELQRIAIEQGLAPESEGAKARAALVVGTRGLAARGAGGAVAAAQMQAQRIGIGGQMAGTFRQLEQIGIQSAQTLGRFNTQIKSLTDSMASMMKAVDKFAATDAQQIMRNLGLGWNNLKSSVGFGNKRPGGNR